MAENANEQPSPTSPEDTAQPSSDTPKNMVQPSSNIRGTDRGSIVPQDNSSYATMSWRSSKSQTTDKSRTQADRNQQ